jgi:hypothetical protein
MKKYKRAKPAKVIMEIYTASTNSVVCPFCHTECRGFSGSTLRLKCFQCENEIILNWK